MSQQATHTKELYTPLISPGFLRKTLTVVLVLAALTVALNLTGRWLGERIARGGHSVETDLRRILIAGEALAFPANALRFEEQRQGGMQHQIDLYLLYPQMTGYSDEDRWNFNDLAASERLVFLTVRENAMQLDMSGRFEAVYLRLTEQSGQSVFEDLIRYDFLDGTRYIDEALYVADRPDQDPFVVRCLGQANVAPGARGCLRDVMISSALSVEYRFSIELLPQWRTLDAAVIAYVTDAITD